MHCSPRSKRRSIDRNQRRGKTTTCYDAARNRGRRLWEDNALKTAHFLRLQNVAQPAKLISLHRHRSQWTEYARVENGSAISRVKDAGRNPPGDPPLPRLRLPSPEAPRPRRMTIRPASPASPHHCQAQPPLGQRNRRRPVAGCDAFRKTAQSRFQFGQGQHLVVFPHGPPLREGDLIIKLAMLVVS
jgi:hypothetical protein